MEAAVTPPAEKFKRTALYPIHKRLGAKMVEFAGWEMPVQYRGIIEEHLAVRSRVGLFDISHMGEIEIQGSGSLDLCQKLTANDVSQIQADQAHYNLLLNENGGVVDDILVYRLEADHFLFCVNAANTEKDFRWIKEQSRGTVEVRDASSRYIQLALQGPLAEKVLQRLTPVRLGEIKAFHFRFGEVAGVPCLISRTGYTGEDGFELYGDPKYGERLWGGLQEAGSGFDLLPAGLGARDTLRLERALPLYGHELDETTTPFEAGLEWVVKLSKGSFLGQEVLLRQKREGLRRKLVGLEMVGPRIARSHYRILKGGRPVGEVTSGTKSPTLGRSIALGYVLIGEDEVGNALEVDIRGRTEGVRVVPLPFYRRQAHS